MPISPPVGGPVPNLGIKEIEITDPSGKVIGREKIRKAKPSPHQKIPLYAKVIAIAIVALFIIFLISLL